MNQALVFIKKLSWLEKVETVVILVLLFNVFFDLEVKLAPRNFLPRLLAGQKAPLPSPLANNSDRGASGLESQVLPATGAELPATWGDLGRQLVQSGVIDEAKFLDLYSQRGPLSPEMKKALQESNNGRIRITPENSGVWLNLLWALGLGNKNEILEKGEMQDKRFNGAQNFASTGGWQLAKGGPMEHYSQHSFVKLTKEQQALVDRVSKNIYRPCCNNSTHFPDCNHGMAMLALLELMASQGVSEPDMYRASLVANSYWFPETYLTIAAYFQKQGTDWSRVDAATVLGAQYSSGGGYQQLLNQVNPVSPSRQGSGCGV